MLEVRIPHIRDRQAFVISNNSNSSWSHGPFGLDGTIVPYKSEKHRSPGDFITQGRELYGEKNVSHRQLDGLATLKAGSALAVEPTEPIYLRASTHYFRGKDYWNGARSLQKSRVYDPLTPQKSVSFTFDFTTNNGKVSVGGSRTQSIVTGKVWLHSLNITYTHLTGQIVVGTGSSPVKYDSMRSNITKRKLLFNGPSLDYKPPYGAPGADHLEYILKLYGNQITSDETTTENGLEEMYYVYSSSNSYDAGDVLRKMENLSTRPFNMAVPELPSFGELAGQAAAAKDANQVNMIAFVKDLKDVKSLIPKLKNLTSLKTHASNYLGYEYGILPTIDDLKTLHESFSKTNWFDNNGYEVLTSGVTESISTPGVGTCTAIRRCKLAISNADSRMSRLLQGMREMGFYPSPQNLWDLVPYSFVIDWFVDIGSVLESIDNMSRVAQLDVVYCTTSTKYVYNITDLAKDVLGDNFDVTLSLSSYSRNTSANAPRPPLSFEAGITAQDHILEGTALILTRR